MRQELEQTRRRLIDDPESEPGMLLDRLSQVVDAGNDVARPVVSAAQVAAAAAPAAIIESARAFAGPEIATREKGEPSSNGVSTVTSPIESLGTIGEDGFVAAGSETPEPEPKISVAESEEEGSTTEIESLGSIVDESFGEPESEAHTEPEVQGREGHYRRCGGCAENRV